MLDRFKDMAISRIHMRDMDDWPVVSAALLLNCPIWTEDKDFFGTGVPTWTNRQGAFVLIG